MKLLKWLEVAGRVLLAGVLISKHYHERDRAYYRRDYVVKIVRK